MKESKTNINNRLEKALVLFCLEKSTYLSEVSCCPQIEVSLFSLSIFVQLRSPRFLVENERKWRDLPKFKT